MSKGDLSFYLDMVLIETAVGNPHFLKTGQAGALSGLGDTVQEYFSAHWDPNNKEASVVNMLAPAAIYAIFRGFGSPIIGLLFGAVVSALHIDVDGMLHSIYNAIVGTVQQGKGVTPSQLDSAVSSAIQEHTAPLSSQDAEEIGQQADQSQAFDKRNFTQELRNARMVRLAMEQYQRRMLQLTKEGAPSSWYSSVSNKRSLVGGILGRIIGWVFKLILGAAGFMIVGDLANKFLGRPNAIDRNWQAGQTSPGEATSTPSHPASATPWVEHVTNDPNSIEQMLLGFVKDIYPTLAGKEEVIKSLPGFQNVKNQIVWYNHTSAGEPEVYIPIMYPDKKSLVDAFAKNAT